MRYTKKQLLTENHLKTFLYISMLLITWCCLDNSVIQTNSDNDIDKINTVLTVVALLLSSVIAGAYTFKYQTKGMARYFGHIITAFFIFSTGILLQVVNLLLSKLGLPTQITYAIWLVSIASFIALILYDYWDYLSSIKTETDKNTLPSSDEPNSIL